MTMQSMINDWQTPDTDIIRKIARALHKADQPAASFRKSFFFLQMGLLSGWVEIMEEPCKRLPNSARGPAI